MRMEIIHHEANFLCMRIMLINKFLDTMRPINVCPLLSDFGVSLPTQWFKSEKNVRCPISFLRSVISQRFSRFSWERRTNFTDQLGRHFIYTHVGTLRVVRCFIDV